MTHWTNEQHAIFEEVRDGQRHLVVRARAGTGKTTTILEALQHAQERDILLAAFNKNIATELQARNKNQAVSVKTLHALGFRMITKNWPGVRVSDDGKRAADLVFRVCGNQIPDGLIGLMKQLHTKVRELAPYASSVQEVEDIASQFDLLPDEEWEHSNYSMPVLAEYTLNILEAARKPTDLIDFADMIYLPLANQWVSPTYSLIFVDEAQDMSKPQLDLAYKSMSDGGRMVLIGDDRQAIYGFRGADSGSLDRMKSELNATELGLKATFRCGRAIVAEANRYVPDLIATDGAHAGDVTTHAEVDPALVAPGSFVLSRVNAPLVGVCLNLLRHDIPAIVKGKDIGKGLTKIVRQCEDPDLDVFLKNVDLWLTKEERRARRLNVYAAHARLSMLYDQAATIAALTENTDTVSTVMKRIQRLFADEATQSAVVCSTVHKAKGLEAPEVWMLTDTWRNDGGEEDNLRYVAITRAKQHLRYATRGSME